MTEAFTGTVMDVEILCNYCEFCILEKPHKICSKNFDGKSGSMETEQAVRMWSRSADLGFQYKTFVSDGDSSAF